MDPTEVSAHPFSRLAFSMAFEREHTFFKILVFAFWRQPITQRISRSTILWFLIAARIWHLVSKD
jgi:hypothetical protein